MAAAATAQVAPLLPNSSSRPLLSRVRQCSPTSVASFSGQLSISSGSLPVLRVVRSRSARTAGVVVCAATEGKEKEEEKAKVESPEIDVETVTRKFGLEAGLWKILSAKGDEGDAGKGKRTSQAKELLKRYGGAYLATSISLSLVSFALCYVLVQSGVDVPSVLEKVGIHVNETGEKVGTVALAYAAHKALSPIRFPPTVALTPIVAAWFGKKAPTDDASQ